MTATLDRIAGHVRMAEEPAVRDPYRFGTGPNGPTLKPGTLGWTASDLEDPFVRGLWDDGRFEIVNGILVAMPPAYFYGGACVWKTTAIVNSYFGGRGIKATFAPEPDIRVRDDQVVCADAACVFGEALNRFRALRFPPPRTGWRQNVLTLPPPLVMESVSQGHEDHDRQTKRRWYAEFGVRHYWILDGLRRTFDCLLLDGTEYRDGGSGHDADVLRPAGFDGLEIPLLSVWGDDED